MTALLAAACSSDTAPEPSLATTGATTTTTPASVTTAPPPTTAVTPTSAVSTIPFPGATSLPTTTTPGDSTTTTNAPPANTSTTSTTTTTQPGGPTPTTTVPVNDAVAATRDAVVAAAAAADWDALETLLDPQSFTYTLGAPDPNGPIAFWQTLQATGTDVLGAMVAIMSLQPQEATGQFVYPYFNGKALADLTATELAELEAIGGTALYDPEDGVYIWWTSIIDTEGDWKWFLKEDV